jgi:hypothetical protein
VANALEENLQRQEEDMNRKHLWPGLRHALRARDLCPALARPHVLIAEHTDKLLKGDSRLTYFQRAKFLVPFDPEIWFFCGFQELQAEQEDQAWANFRRSLELSDRRLPDILLASWEHLKPNQLIDRVLPGKPETLLAAALELYPQPENLFPRVYERWNRTPHLWASRLILAGASTGAYSLEPAGGAYLAFVLAWDYPYLEERRPFLEKALGLLETQGKTLRGTDYHVKAWAHWLLWQTDQAESAFKMALIHEGLNGQWRLEYAHLLFQQGHLREAQRELVIVESLPSPPVAAKFFLNVVNLRIAESQDLLK